MKRGRKIPLAALYRIFARVSRGSSLMEMVVVLAILSLLAALAAPYARMSIKREKEMQLRETLRTVKIAIDRFHTDVGSRPGQKDNKKEKQGISENGYPLSLQVLVDGVEVAGGQPPGNPALANSMPGNSMPGNQLPADRPPAAKKLKRFLRALPQNPFALPGTPFEAQWTFVSYQRQAPMISSSSYGTTLAEAQDKAKEDIYDLHAVTPEIAIDGTRYANW